MASTAWRRTKVAEKALGIWNRRPGKFDLLLTDLVILGGTAGETLAENLKAQNRQLRIVDTADYRPESVGINAKCLDGGWFIPKPFTLRALADTVAAARAAGGTMPPAGIGVSR